MRNKETWSELEAHEWNENDNTDTHTHTYKYVYIIPRMPKTTAKLEASMIIIIIIYDKKRYNILWLVSSSLWRIIII